MVIKSIELFHLAIPLNKSFETSFGIVKERPALIFKITSQEGLIGFGESSPLYIPISEPETLNLGMRVLKQLLPQLINQDYPSLNELNTLLAPIREIKVSKLGIEGAYCHLLSLQNRTPLQNVFGSARPSIEVGESVGINSSLPALLREIAAFNKRGFKRVKIKIKPGHDLDIIKAIRAAYPDMHLAIDANEAYQPKDINLFKQLDAYNLMFIEQPFSTSAYQAHAQLRQLIHAPICLDESVYDLASCKKAIRAGSCDIINIKPARIGSYFESLAIHDYCQKKQIRLFGGGRMETGLGRLINASFYSLPGFNMPADLTPPLDYFSQDIVSPPFTVHNGVFNISTTIGLGASILESVISNYTRERYVF